MGTKELIKKFGTMARAAELLEVSKPLMRHWCNTGRIPKWHWENLQAAAAFHGVAIRREDLAGVSVYNYRGEAYPNKWGANTHLHMRLGDLDVENLQFLIERYPNRTTTSIVRSLIMQQVRRIKRRDRQLADIASTLKRPSP